jgi:DeoR/GlpR family transcriptional regulator of sugar metabolism
MLKKTRLDQIVRLIRDQGSVEISELCRLFDVTEMTARRDLDTLAAAGRVTRTHGGALLPADDVLVEKPFEARMAMNHERKEAIARVALEHIVDGQKLFFNNSTSVYSLVNLIDNTRRLVVVTDTLHLAEELNKRSKVSVLQLGGELQKKTLSCTGNFAEVMLRQLHFDQAFVGIKAIDESGNLYCNSVEELGLYQGVFATADRVLILADSSKIGKKDFILAGNLKQIATLITDDKIAPDQLARFRELGFTVELAPGPAEA